MDIKKDASKSKRGALKKKNIWNFKKSTPISEA